MKKILIFICLCFVLHAPRASAAESGMSQTSGQARLDLRRILVGLLGLDISSGAPREDLRSAVEARFPAGYSRTEVDRWLSTIANLNHPKCRVKITEKPDSVLVDIMYKFRREDQSLGAVGAHFVFWFAPNRAIENTSYVEYANAADLNP